MDCRDILTKKKTEAGDHIYIDCKTQLLAVHGPKPEEDFNKARNLIFGGLPSDTAKRIRDLVCQKPKKLTDCCCAVSVGTL